MIHLVDLSDGVDGAHHIVLALPIEAHVTAVWFMWSERKLLFVCCVIKASSEWLVTKVRPADAVPKRGEIAAVSSHDSEESLSASSAL